MNLGSFSIFGASPTNILKTQLKNHVPFFNAADSAKDRVEPQLGLNPANRGTSGQKAKAGAGTSPKAATDTNNGGDESAANLGNGGSGGSGSGSTNGYSAADLAYLDSQAGILKGLLGRSGVALKQGLENLNDSFNQQQGQANKDRSRAMEDYAMQDETNNNNKNKALTSIGNNARVLADGLRRRFALTGGSDSSAYQFAVPEAVAHDASVKQNDELTTFAENDRSVGTSRKRAGEDFDKLLSDLAAQRKTKEGDLRTGILQNEQDVEKQLADIVAQKNSGQDLSRDAAHASLQPIADQIKGKQSAIDSIFEKYRTPTFNVAPVKANPALLRDYLVKNTGQSSDSSDAPLDPESTAAYYKKKLQDATATA